MRTKYYKMYTVRIITESVNNTSTSEANSISASFTVFEFQVKKHYENSFISKKNVIFYIT
jgi:hypothetical protein